MEINEKIKYWIDLADYDIETAEAMLQARRFLYVGFMCNQSVEKILKALFVKSFNTLPPKIHSLNRLIRKIGIENDLIEEMSNIIDKLEPLNIEARYPTYKEEIFNLLTPEYCIEIMNGTKELVSWIKKKL